jgi:hypothetical protein
MGAVAWGQWPSPHFPSPLIEPDVRSYRIRLSPTGFTARHTTGHVMAGVQHPAFPMQYVESELVVTAPCDFVSSDEECAQAPRLLGGSSPW